MKRWWRMSKRLFVVGGAGAFIFMMAAAIEVYRFGQVTETRPADAAIVLGAAVFGNRPSPVLRERINHAIGLYERGEVEMIIFTGGQGQPGEPAEAIVAKRYALTRGVPEAAILIETTSTNTQENLRNAKQVAMAHELQSFLIVSTPFHMKRAMAIADDLEMEAYTSPTRTTRWISGYTKSRSYVREVLGYAGYLLLKL